MKITELRKKLLQEGCNPKNFAVLSSAHDAYCIDKDNNLWNVFYSERGCNYDPIFTSSDESEACDFFYNLVINQQHWHLVGFFKKEIDATLLEDKLVAIGITPIRNDIPAYKTGNDPRYRVFVVGKDIFKTKEHFGPIEITFE